MNGTYLYSTYSDNSFTPTDDSSTSAGENNGGGGSHQQQQQQQQQQHSQQLDSINTTTSDSNSRKAAAAIMARNNAPNSHLSNSSGSGAANNNQRRQTLPMEFSGNQSQLENTMRRVSAVDFTSQGNQGLNAFSFDPNSLAGGLDPALAGDLQQMNLEFETSGKAAPDLSVNTQFANSMGFNQMAAQNANFTSQLEMNMSPYMGSAGPMGMGMGMGMDMDLMGGPDGMSGMNDMFNTQQFESPIMTSPMNSTFQQALYGNAGSLNTSNPMMDDQPNLNGNGGFQLPTTSGPGLNMQMAQTEQMPPPMSKSAGMAQGSTTSSSNRKAQQNLATIGNLTLPWQTPQSRSFFDMSS
jgi:hypothetical protein